MNEREQSTSNSFTSAMALAKMGVLQVPSHFVLPPSQRPNTSFALKSSSSITPPILDLSLLQNPSCRPSIVEEVRLACKELVFFQVINHGIPSSVIKDAIDAASEFFDLPNEEKMQLLSDDVHKPVRYGTSMNHVKDKVHFWRDFIKHYSRPIYNWIDQWPSNRPSYRENLGNYAKAAHALQKQLMGVVFESLGLSSNYLQEDIEEGSQVIAVNCYPACPEPELSLGMPPHFDYGSITTLLQNHPGLQIMDQEKNWHPIPITDGALIVQLGDQMEVMSNGQYKGVMHRAAVNSENRRISVASLHSLALEKKVAPALELVDEQHPLSYKGGSFKDFLEHIPGNDVLKLGRYIDTLKKNP
ncbi:Flavanone 3-dioxygenase [Bertholletia excelsa]